MTETRQQGQESHKVLTLQDRVNRLGRTMCVSRITGRNTSPPTRTQMMLNEWAQVQDCRRQNRQGYQPTSYSDI
jgi:hypothetical protein